MKRITCIISSILFLSFITTVLAASNNKTSSVNPSVSTHPRIHQVNMRLRNQWTLVQKNIKTGKLTKEQVVSLREALKEIRIQEVNYFKQNNNHELTPDQQNQLNTLLDKNSATVGENTSDSN